MTITRKSIFGAALAAPMALAMAMAGPASAQSMGEKPFYAGKDIKFMIGGSPGGGFDTYARVISRHLGSFIPGRPDIIAQNMQGAGSRKAAGYIYRVAPKDGTEIAAIFPGAIMAPLLDERGKSKYDSTKFIYLGSANKGTRICATFEGSKTKTFEDAQQRETIMAASARGGATRDFPAFLNKLAGTKFDLVSGYKGTKDMILAMERGEVAGLCGYYWSSLKTQKPQWISEGKLHVLVQMALDPHPELTKMGVPEIWKFVDKGQDTKLMELLVSQQIFGRPYVAPSGVPLERVISLRQAFSATFIDEGFLADAKKARLAVDPTEGIEVQQLVNELFGTPKPIVERAKEIIKIGGSAS